MTLKPISTCTDPTGKDIRSPDICRLGLRADYYLSARPARKWAVRWLLSRILDVYPSLRAYGQDPQEQHNLVLDPQYKATVDELKKELEKGKKNRIQPLWLLN